jgi:hypothetical protein
LSNKGDLKIKIPIGKDFYSGVVFISFGLTAMLVARNYPVGTADRMGPGYFPVIVGGMLTLLGLVIAVVALWRSSEAIKLEGLRALLLVHGGVLAFAAVINPLGLVLALLVLIVISCLGSQEFRIPEVITLYLVLTAMALGLFVYGLGLSFKVWPI